MTKLPNCPICESDELWHQHDKDGSIVACYYCGWRCHIAPLPPGLDIDTAIAAIVVAAAKPHAGDDAADESRPIAPTSIP